MQQARSENDEQIQQARSENNEQIQPATKEDGNQMQTKPFDQMTTLNIRMDRQEIKAINGQFVQISCYLLTSKCDFVNELILVNMRDSAKKSKLESF